MSFCCQETFDKAEMLKEIEGDCPFLLMRFILRLSIARCLVLAVCQY